MERNSDLPIADKIKKTLKKQHSGHYQSGKSPDVLQELQNKKTTGLQSLPQELFDSITKYLLPISYLNPERAFENAKTNPGFDDDQIKAAQVWDKIFENEKWLEAVMSLKSENVSPPLPVLVGTDVNKLYQWHTCKGHTGKYHLALAYANCSGCLMNNQITLGHSLRGYRYDEEANELWIKRTNIIISLEKHQLCYIQSDIP